MKRVFAVLVLAAALLAVPAAASADDGSYHSLRSATNPDWMRGLPDSRSLAALSIPGTHETMSIFGGGLTQTQQDVSDAPGQTDENKRYGKSGAALAVQLRAGIRMIDIRARVNTGNTFVIHHGAVYQTANFDNVLTTLSGFLTAHPGETVLLRLKQECTGETGSCTDVAGQNSFPDIFDAYAARYPGLFWAPSIDRNIGAAVPSLGEVRGKVVLAVMNGAHGGRWANYGLAQFSGWNDGSSSYVQDNYSVPTIFQIDDKTKQTTAFLETTNSGDPGAMYVNFASGSGLLALPAWVAGSVDPSLLSYLGGHDLHRTGVIMMDFPGGALINKIISYDQG